MDAAAVAACQRQMAYTQFNCWRIMSKQPQSSGHHAKFVLLLWQESQDLLGRQSPEASMSHSVSHMPAVPPKDIAAAWNLAPADMHRRVDAAAAFNNNSSYSTAFLNTNGFSSKLSGGRPSAPGPIGQLPQPARLSQGGQIPQAAQTVQPGYSAVHAAPFRPRAQQLPTGLVCPLTKVTIKYYSLYHSVWLTIVFDSVLVKAPCTAL